MEDCEHVCHCLCHTQPIMHFRACCFVCPDCNKRIEDGRRIAEEHKTRCHGHTQVDEE